MLAHHVPILSFEYHLTDPVQDYCWRAGYSYPVIIGTYTYLLAQWETVVESVLTGDIPCFYDYVNAMDGRKILDQLFAIPNGKIPVSVRIRVTTADARLRSSLVPSSVCIWGAEQAETYGYSPETHWYYYTIPVHAPPDWAVSG